MLAPLAAVMAAVAAGWLIEPPGIQADQTRPLLVVREPAERPVIDAPAVVSDGSPAEGTRAAREHAVVVDADLDIDVDHATGHGH